MHSWQIPSERRTLPSELPGPSRRRTFQKRGNSQSPREEGHGHMQVSCSLPETPIFARGCDIPRTPHRRAPDVPPIATRTTPRPAGLQNSYRRTTLAPGTGNNTMGTNTMGTNVSLGRCYLQAFQSGSWGTSESDYLLILNNLESFEVLIKICIRLCTPHTRFLPSLSLHSNFLYFERGFEYQPQFLLLQ